MAFKLDDIIIDRIQMAIATDTNDTEMYYVLTQLSEANIEITAESKEARDKDGTLIKKFWTGKSGTFTATNAMINLNVIGEASGSKKQALAASDLFPAIKTGKPGEVVATPYLSEGTLKVHVIGNNGTMGDNVTSKATATGYGTEGATVTLPQDIEGATKFVMEYQRTNPSAVVIRNQADKFPGTVRLVMKVLAIEPCSPDKLRAGYLVLPSFQVSPEVNVSLTTDATLDYTGDLQVNYCGTEKTLYEFYWAEDDIEEE